MSSLFWSPGTIPNGLGRSVGGLRTHTLRNCQDAPSAASGLQSWKKYSVFAAREQLCLEHRAWAKPLQCWLLCGSGELSNKVTHRSKCHFLPLWTLLLESLYSWCPTSPRGAPELYLDGFEGATEEHVV